MIPVMATIIFFPTEERQKATKTFTLDSQRVTNGARIPDYGRRLERQATAIAAGGAPQGYLLCDSSRRTFLR